jgi:hypothetical protein
LARIAAAGLVILFWRDPFSGLDLDADMMQ